MRDGALPTGPSGGTPSSGAARHLLPDGEKKGAPVTGRIPLPVGERLGEGDASRARQLRRRASDAENVLWYFLRNRNLDGHKFVRQMPIGRYLADFACRELGLIIEIDGGQHSTSASDASRTAWLNGQGYAVLRFWNNEVLQNRNGVWLAIRSVAEGTPFPDLRYAAASSRGLAARGTRAASAAQTSLALKQARSGESK